MRAEELTEEQLADHLPSLAPQVGIELLDTEVSLGKYRLDAVAKDRSGSLVVIELKTRARLDAIGQLLLYPRALARFAGDITDPPPTIRSALIATHLDSNVVELMESLKLSHAVDFWVCVGKTGRGLRLVRPSEANENQYWDQYEEGSMARTNSIREYLSGRQSGGA